MADDYLGTYTGPGPAIRETVHDKAVEMLNEAIKLADFGTALLDNSDDLESRVVWKEASGFEATLDF